MILDTNAVSALLSGDRQIGQVLAGVDHHLPLGVIAEYEFGLLTSGRGKRLQSLFRRLESHSVLLCPDRETARWYASIRHELKRRGTRIPKSDIWISALARQHVLEIASQDSHIDLVDRVKRVRW